MVDGGSTDRTVEVVQQRAAQDARVRLLRNPGRIQSAGLGARPRRASRGPGRSSGSTPARSSSPTTSPGASSCSTPRAPPRSAAGWSPARPPRRSPGGSPWPTGRGGVRGRRGSTGAGEPGPADTVYLGAFDASWLRKVGGWAPDLPTNEDWELNYRLRQAGGVVWLDPVPRGRLPAPRHAAAPSPASTSATGGARPPWCAATPRASCPGRWRRRCWPRRASSPCWPAPPCCVARPAWRCSPTSAWCSAARPGFPPLRPSGARRPRRRSSCTGRGPRGPGSAPSRRTGAARGTRP